MTQPNIFQVKLFSWAEPQVSNFPNLKITNQGHQSKFHYPISRFACQISYAERLRSIKGQNMTELELFLWWRSKFPKISHSDRIPISDVLAKNSLFRPCGLNFWGINLNLFLLSDNFIYAGVDPGIFCEPLKKNEKNFVRDRRQHRKFIIFLKIHKIPLQN